jgi:hypothetical protein
MDVRMRYFQPNGDDINPVAPKRFFNGFGDWLRKDKNPRQVIIGHIEDLIHFHLGYHQRMAILKRKDVQESKELIAFRYFITRNFSADDLRKDGHTASFAQGTSSAVVI